MTAKDGTYKQVGIVMTHGRIHLNDAHWYPDSGYAGTDDRLASAHANLSGENPRGEAIYNDGIGGTQTFTRGRSGYLFEIPVATEADDGMAFPVLAAVNAQGQVAQLIIDLEHPVHESGEAEDEEGYTGIMASHEAKARERHPNDFRDIPEAGTPERAAHDERMTEGTKPHC